jgi:hypothetical protein
MARGKGHAAEASDVIISLRYSYLGLEPLARTDFLPPGNCTPVLASCLESIWNLEDAMICYGMALVATGYTHRLCNLDAGAPS